MSDPEAWIRRESARLGLPLDDDDIRVVARFVEDDAAALAALRSASTTELEPPFLLRLAQAEREEG